MGCLSVNVSVINGGIGCSTSVATSPISIISVNENTPLHIIYDNVTSNVNILLSPYDDTFKVNISSKNVKVKIKAALICTVGMGNVELFYVTQGPLIVKNGYFLVKRAE